MADPTTLYQPFSTPVTRADRHMTDPWIGWVRALTKQAQVGANAAPANAFYLLSTANATLVNGRVLSDTASVTWDTSVANVVKANAVIRKGDLLTLTNAQVKSWADSNVSIIAAQGANTRTVIVIVEIITDFSAGAYTNVNANGSIVGALAGAETGYTNYLVNDSSIPLTQVSTFFSAQKTHVNLVNGTLAEPVNSWGNLAFPDVISAASYNVAYLLNFDNGGSGALTGGNAANTCKVRPYYLVESF